QAEDGIRDFHVTGVQTCALPIFHSRSERLDATGNPAHLRALVQLSESVVSGAVAAVCDRFCDYLLERLAPRWPADAVCRSGRIRSEERRVGKECRARRTRAPGTG